MTIGKESSKGRRSKAEAEIRTKKMNAWHTKRGGGNGKCEEGDSVTDF